MANNLEEKLTSLQNEVNNIQMITNKLIEKATVEQGESSKSALFISESFTPKKAEVFDKICDKCDNVLTSIPSKSEIVVGGPQLVLGFLGLLRQLLNICLLLQSLKSYISLAHENTQNKTDEVEVQKTNTNSETRILKLENNNQAAA